MQDFCIPFRYLVMDAVSLLNHPTPFLFLTTSHSRYYLKGSNIYNTYHSSLNHFRSSIPHLILTSAYFLRYRFYPHGEIGQHALTPSISGLVHSVGELFFCEDDTLSGPKRLYIYCGMAAVSFV